MMELPDWAVALQQYWDYKKQPVHNRMVGLVVADDIYRENAGSKEFTWVVLQYPQLGIRPLDEWEKSTQESVDAINKIIDGLGKSSNSPTTPPHPGDGMSNQNLENFYEYLKT